ncbi:DUF1642 domain-containing protein [Streptococcus oralis]|uniref:DUF1642 domain-containing protein n=1 Tax=Streptococcus oralis TaxID=1303 RepID=UPI00200078E3|nr:DUF1642 domain-containing protein [Streptococcus oralis]
MNKQELIEKIIDLGRPCLDVVELVKQLDEPEMGHADEAPRYLKNILARLRELPLHDREVWLKVIMSEFKQDFSHAKWREGYEQGKLEGMVEREKVTIPQFVADWLKENDLREETLGEQSVFDVFDSLKNDSKNGYYENVKRWIDENGDLFARAWLDGYEVEEEKRYKVVMPNISSTGGVLTRIEHNDSWIWIDTIGTIVEGRTHTRKEIEDAGFGWVFDCPGIEVEEVE